MKRYKLYLLLGIALGWLFSGCQEKEIYRYENDPRLYFFKGIIYYPNNTSFIQRDSVKQTFFVKPDSQKRDTVWVDVRTMGFPTNYPRPVKLVQSNIGEPDAAIPGVHYVAFDDEELREKMCIEAGNVRQFIPVVLLRDPSLEQAIFRIKMDIAPNDYFAVGMDTLAHFQVTTTAMPDKPSLWNSYWSGFFGDYGTKKMWFLVNYVGLKDFNTRITDRGYLAYLRAKAVEALAVYNADERNPDRPLKEADGNPVKFLEI